MAGTPASFAPYFRLGCARLLGQPACLPAPAARPARQRTTAARAAALTEANGSLTEDETGGLYTWDVRGRLLGLTKGGNSYLFQYGPDNLRVNKSVNGVLTTYLLDGDQVVTDTINGTAYQNLFGPGTDHPLARNGEFFLPNHLSSATGLTNGSGSLTQSYLYGPFGESLNAPSDSNPFQYTGGRTMAMACSTIEHAITVRAGGGSSAPIR